MEPGPCIGRYRAPNPCFSSDELKRAENRDLPSFSVEELIWERKRLLDALDFYEEHWQPYCVYLGTLPGVPFDVWARACMGRFVHRLNEMTNKKWRGGGGAGPGQIGDRYVFGDARWRADE